MNRLKATMKLKFKKIAGIVLFAFGMSVVCTLVWEYANYVNRGLQWTPRDVYTIVTGWLFAGLGIFSVSKCGENLTIQIRREI
jgi:hypothetical protein